MSEAFERRRKFKQQKRASRSQKRRDSREVNSAIVPCSTSPSDIALEQDAVPSSSSQFGSHSTFSHPCAVDTASGLQAAATSDEGVRTAHEERVKRESTTMEKDASKPDYMSIKALLCGTHEEPSPPATQSRKSPSKKVVRFVNEYENVQEMIKASHRSMKKRPGHVLKSILKTSSSNYASSPPSIRVVADLPSLAKASHQTSTTIRKQKQRQSPRYGQPLPADELPDLSILSLADPVPCTQEPHHDSATHPEPTSGWVSLNVQPTPISQQWGNHHPYQGTAGPPYFERYPMANQAETYSVVPMSPAFAPFRRMSSDFVIMAAVVAQSMIHTPMYQAVLEPLSLDPLSDAESMKACKDWLQKTKFIFAGPMFRGDHSTDTGAERNYFYGLVNHLQNRGIVDAWALVREISIPGYLSCGWDEHFLYAFPLQNCKGLHALELGFTVSALTNSIEPGEGLPDVNEWYRRSYLRSLARTTQLHTLSLVVGRILPGTPDFIVTECEKWMVRLACHLKHATSHSQTEVTILFQDDWSVPETLKDGLFRIEVDGKRTGAVGVGHAKQYHIFGFKPVLEVDDVAKISDEPSQMPFADHTRYAESMNLTLPKMGDSVLESIESLRQNSENPLQYDYELPVRGFTPR